MKLNFKMRSMLGELAISARRANHFTHGIEKQYRPEVLQMYLDAMAEEGLIMKVDGAYRITTNGRKVLDQKEVVTSDKVVGRGTYRTGDGDYGITLRPGAMDAYSLPSRGF